VVVGMDMGGAQNTKNQRNFFAVKYFSIVPYP